MINATHTLQLAELQTWLKNGWQIEEPVVQHSAFYDQHGRVCAVEINVTRQGQRCVVTLGDTPTVQRFLIGQRLTVLDLA